MAGRGHNPARRHPPPMIQVTSPLDPATLIIGGAGALALLVLLFYLTFRWV